MTVDKSEIPFVSGLLIAIRAEPTGGEGQYVFGQNPATWEEDRQLKISLGEICCIDDY